MTPRQKVYGSKKKFISEHWNDISFMRKRMSAAKVAKVYGGLISKYNIQQYEKMYTK
jgi:hypothetical protein